MQEGLFEFERTYLERLKLACEVLLELAGEIRSQPGWKQNCMASGSG